MKRQVQWQYMVLTKGDGLLITAGERKGRRQSNCQTQESMWWYRQGKAGTVYLEIWFPPPLSGVFPTCSCSSPSKYSYQGFSLTPPFPRKLSVLLLQLVSLASKSPDALSVRMTFLLHPDFCLHRPASHTRERGSTRWLCTAVAGALGFLPPATARPPALPHKHHFPLPLQRPWMWRARSKCRVPLRLSWLFSGNSRPWDGQVSRVPATAPPGRQNGCPSCPGSVLLQAFPNDLSSFLVSVAKPPFHDFCHIISFHRL